MANLILYEFSCNYTHTHITESFKLKQLAGKIGAIQFCRCFSKGKQGGEGGVLIVTSVQLLMFKGGVGGQSTASDIS